MVATGAGTSAMAVRAYDLAFLDLIENPLPAIALQRVSDRERLVAQVVEVEHDGIVLAVVRARVIGEVLDQVLGPLTSNSLAVGTRSSDVPLAIGAVVRGSVA